MTHETTLGDIGLTIERGARLPSPGHRGEPGYRGPAPRTGVDAQTAIEHLRRLTSSPASGLVFFVGAGLTSWTVPGLNTQALIQELVADAAREAGLTEELVLTGRGVSEIGFEMVLNDLFQICADRVEAEFGRLSVTELASEPNLGHRFMAQWLEAGGAVVRVLRRITWSL